MKKVASVKAMQKKEEKKTTKKSTKKTAKKTGKKKESFVGSIFVVPVCCKLKYMTFLIIKNH